MNAKLSRRRFLQRSATGLAAITVVPSSVLGSRVQKTAPTDKLNIAGIGVGGKGVHNLRNMNSQNIVALCDVDWNYSKKVFEEFPNAQKFWDYREMFDKIDKEIEGVVIATADHTHAIIASEAMVRGKHVYLQKPLTHSVYESRLLTKLAQKYKVATQMGNEGASGDGFRLAADVIHAGILGDVYKVEVYTDRPIWPQGLLTPLQADPVPDTLRWDLFIGPAAMRPFNKAYHPWNWRGWWDFGTGALGDIGCHSFHPVWNALKLGTPATIQGTSTALFPDSAPLAEMVRYTFPARGKLGKSNLAEVSLDWYDGGLKPFAPKGTPEGKKMGGGGTIYHGTKDTLVLANGTYLTSGKELNVPKVSRIIETSHEMDWVRAAKENASNRVPTVSNFDVAGPLNEMVVAGVAALRLQSLDRPLKWDGPNMRFNNIGADETVNIILREGYTVKDGHPTLDKPKETNALAFVQEILKHTYHNGFKLVDMPQ